MTVRAGRLGVVSVVLALAACTAPATPNPPVPPAAPLSTAPSGSRDFAPGSATGGDPLFPAMGDGGYDATHYGLTLTYDAATGTIDADDVVTATATQALSRFDLDLHGLTVRSVTVGGKPARYTRQADKLVVTPATGIVSGTTFVTEVRYGGLPTPYDDPVLGLEGFMERGGGVVVQGEPQVAASWFPVNDTPRDKASYDITVTTASTLSVLSNGILVSKQVVGPNATWHWAESAPMASYLAMLLIGAYRVVTGTFHGLPMVLAVESSLPTSVDAVLAQTPQVLDFLISQFGPYPFDSVGGIVHDDPAIPFALENQTRPVYAPAFFTAGADDTSVLAHELAHQWYGDDVTVDSWADVWLNEGFATYAQWLWTEHEGGQTPKQTFDDTYYGRHGQSLPAQPAAAPGTPAQVFGNSAYVRGAATLEALRITVGDDVFWQIVRGWPAYKHFANATTAEFVAYADQVSGRSLDAFLQPWLYGTGTPPYPKPLS